MTRRWRMLVGLVLLSCGLALWQGQDRNWDLLNYHLYNSFAWLHGRYGIDLMPAQRQTWHNPLLDLPFYLLAVAPLSGVVATLWLALFAGVGLWLCLRLLELMTAETPSRIAEAACLVIAASGAAAYSAIGTTFNEWPTAAFLLAALALLIRELGRPAPGARSIALAGFLAGAAFGLKYTAAYNCLAMALLCPLAAPYGHRLRSLAALAVGGIAGAFCTAGYWMWFVYEWTGNPFFPYHNDIFHSPQAAPAPHRGSASIAKASWHTVVATWDLAFGSRRFSEARVRDPRLLAGLVLSVAALPVLLPRRWQPGRESARNLGALLLFFLLSLVSWRLFFAQVRFAIVPECIVAVAVVASLVRSRTPVVRTLSLTAVAATLLLATERQHYQRISFTTPFLENRHPELPAGSAVVMLTAEPVAYATVGLPDSVPVYSLHNNVIGPGRCTPWLDQALERASRAAHLWALQQLEAPDPIELEVGRHYGFAPPEECKRIASTLGDAWLCALKIAKPLACVR